MEELDREVGRLLDTLRTEGLDRSTLVVFTSDNGPWLTQGALGGSAGPLKEGKGIAWWPGTVKPGVTGEIACAMDLLPTALKLAGAEPSADRPLDGRDLSGLLLRGEPGRAEFVYDRGPRVFAVRKGPWKAHLVTRPGYGMSQPVEHDPPLLFHLGHDPGELRDVAKANPAVVADLAALAKTRAAEVTPRESQIDAILDPKT